jgi:hypothetical protein
MVLVLPIGASIFNFPLLTLDLETQNHRYIIFHPPFRTSWGKVFRIPEFFFGLCDSSITLPNFSSLPVSQVGLLSAFINVFITPSPKNYIRFDIDMHNTIAPLILIYSQLRPISEDVGVFY